MMSILHFRKQLTGPPVAADVPGIRLGNLSVPDDIPAWLSLRNSALAAELPPARPWSTADFHREMTAKSWWRAEHSWVAIQERPRLDSHSIVGAVTLATREGPTGPIPVAHWLLVEPNWRRRGIARLLMSQLEQAVWNSGRREVQLETHTNWHAAVAFYQSIGYAAPRDRSPR